MLVRFVVDPDTDLLHIEQHGVEPQEVLEILRGPADSGPGRDGTRVLEGQTRSGLRVIYRENDSDSSILVITAYDLGGKVKAAFRSRRRRRP